MNVPKINPLAMQDSTINFNRLVYMTPFKSGQLIAEV